jgi:hypothetical protein
MHQYVLRLAGLLACVALATSRLGLLAHEHRGMAVAVGPALATCAVIAIGAIM